VPEKSLPARAEHAVDPLPPARRTPNRKGEGGRLRSDLLDAAARVLVAKGPSGVTLRAVAREANVTAPALYLHFEDRDDLVWHLLLRTWEELAKAMDEADRKAADEGPFAQLEAQLAAYVDYATKNPTHYELLFSASPDFARVAEEDYPTPWPVYYTLERAVVRCREAGFVMPLGRDETDPTTVLLFVVAHGRIAIGHAAQRMPFSGRAATHAFVAESLRSLVRPPASRTRESECGGASPPSPT